MSLKKMRGVWSEKVDSVVNRARQTQEDIDFINAFLVILRRKDTKVDLFHQTPVMQKYKITYTVDGGIVHQAIIEYAGSLVKFYDYFKIRFMDTEGYIGLKLKCLHKELQNKSEPRESLFERIVGKFKEHQY